MRAVVFSALVAASATTHCALRVGSKGHGSAGSLAPHAAYANRPPSACMRTGNETKLAFGSGSASFAFAWAGDHYVVVYEDPSTGNGDIYVATLRADGALRSGPVVIEATPASSNLPNLVQTDHGYLVVWQEGSAGMTVYAHSLGPDAMPTGSGVTVASTQLSPSLQQQARPVLAPAPGGQVAVSWMDIFGGVPGVQVALVDAATLQVTAPQRMAQSDVDGWPWIAGDGQTLGMVWSDSAGGSPYGIRFAAVDGHSLAPSQSVPLHGNPNNNNELARLIRTSFGYLAAWEDYTTEENEIDMALIDPGGNPLGGGLVEEPNSGDANWPNMAWDGSSAGVVYYQWRDDRPQVFMSFIDATGARVGGRQDLQVSNGSSGWSKYPDVVWTGNSFGAMYVDTRDGPPQLWFQQVSCTR